MDVQIKYTVYKITNLVNNKIYIGVHKTSNLDDGYMGSGIKIKRAIKKYGIDNFIKEYIAIFDNPEDMFKMESELVNEDFLFNVNSYNISRGGMGSFDYANDNYWTTEKRIEHGKKYGSVAGSWVSLEKRRKIWKSVSIEKRQEIGKKMGKKYGGQNKLSEIEILQRLEKIKDIDLTIYGWVKHVSQRLGLTHTQTKRFINKYYKGNFYTRKT